jgi:hypothetical protein
MQNQAPALRHFSQFSNQGSGTRRDFFVTHHASNDDTLKALQDKDFSDFLGSQKRVQKNGLFLE